MSEKINNVLKLQQDTFFKKFNRPHRDGEIHLTDQDTQYVQPNDGILKGYHQVQVTSSQLLGFGDWGKILVDVITTFEVKPYDDLSVKLTVVKIEVPAKSEYPTKQ